jgi:hypothetical protein
MSDRNSGDFDPKGVTSGFSELLKPLTRVASVRKGPGSFRELTTALQAVPEDIGAQISAARVEVARQVELERMRRSESFGRTFSAFVTRCRDQGRTVREAEGWRIDELEIRTRPDASEVAILYNRAPIGDWLGVSSANELETAYLAATSDLRRHDLPQESLIEALWDAYRYLALTGRRPTASVPIRDLHREIRAALVRHEIGKKVDRSMKVTEMPYWAFLHNLDRYRDLAGAVPHEKRLVFQTGSQADTKRIGITLNGLRANEEYKSYCYVEPAVRGAS